MMRMLYRGGLQVFADNTIAFESVLPTKLPHETSFIPECEGKAFKVLSPLEHRPPYGPHYKFILMDRNHKELLRSHAKWERGNRDWPLIKTPGYVKKYLYDAKLILGRYPHSSVLVVRFDDILEDPLREAWRVAEFLNKPMDIDRMVSCVHKRSPECLPHLEEWNFEEEK
jgi:hypothetical protein